MQFKEQLPPAEGALDDAAAMLQPMKPQLDKLKDLLQDGSDQAQDAVDGADQAQNEAAAGNKVSFSSRTQNRFTEFGSKSAESGERRERETFNSEDECKRLTASVLEELGVAVTWCILLCECVVNG